MKNDMSNYSVLTKEQEKDLFLKLSSSDENERKQARFRIIMSNVKLVSSIALGYINKNLSYEDLISYGIIGLISAVDKFDISKDVRFSTYACYRIERYIRFALSDIPRAIKVERHFQGKMKLCKRKYDEYIVKNGRKPSIDEMVKITGLKKEEIFLIQSLEYEIVSLSTTVYDEETTLYDYVSYDDKSIEEIVEERELYRTLSNCLSKLTEKERKVICCIYGLYGYSSMTQKQIGEIIGCTHQNVSRIEKNALGKLGKSRKLALCYK